MPQPKKAEAGDDGSGLREQLQRLLNPLDVVVVSRERLQEVVDDAVARGRITRDDANELVSRLVARSRQQTESMLRDLERLIGQARDRLR